MGEEVSVADTPALTVWSPEPGPQEEASCFELHGEVGAEGGVPRSC